MAAHLLNPADLVSITALAAQGKFPKALKTIRDLCRSGKFPSVKDGRDWKTTELAIRHYFYKGANPAMRRLCS